MLYDAFAAERLSTNSLNKTIRLGTWRCLLVESAFPVFALSKVNELCIYSGYLQNSLSKFVFGE